MNRLTDKDFSFKCPMSWDDMEATANGKFCSKCRKEVFDLTNCSVDQVRELQDKHGSICRTIRVAQVAVVALSLSAAACQEMERTTGAPLPIPHKTKASQTMADAKPTAQVMGEIDPPSVDTLKDLPIKEADPFAPNHNAPMILGRICPQPDPNQKNVPSGPTIDI